MFYEAGRATGCRSDYIHPRFVRYGPFEPPIPINGVLSRWFSDSIDDAGSLQMLAERTAIGVSELRAQDTKEQSQAEQVRAMVTAGATPVGLGHDGEEEEVEKTLDVEDIVGTDPAAEAEERQHRRWVRQWAWPRGNGGGRPRAQSTVMVSGVRKSSMIS